MQKEISSRWMPPRENRFGISRWAAQSTPHQWLSPWMEKSTWPLPRAVRCTHSVSPKFSFSRRTRQHKHAGSLECAPESPLHYSLGDGRSESLRTASADIGSPTSAAEGKRQGWPGVGPTLAGLWHRPNSSDIDRYNCRCAQNASHLHSLDSTNASTPDCAAWRLRALPGLVRPELLCDD